MRIGFLGTGVIADAIIRGLVKTTLPISEIVVSARNAAVAERLAADFEQVTIATDNQILVDSVDMVFVGLRAQVAESILKALVFRPQQKIVSLIATATQQTVQSWIGHEAVVLRAVPLPFVEAHQSVTPIFPMDEDLASLFRVIGGVVAVKSEHDLNVFMTAGSFMGVYYQFMSVCHDWLKEQGLTQEETGPYLSQLFVNLAQQAKGETVDFKALQVEYSTPGGTNELVATAFKTLGGNDALKQSFDAAFAKINQK